MKLYSIIEIDYTRWEWVWYVRYFSPRTVTLCGTLGWWSWPWLLQDGITTWQSKIANKIAHFIKHNTRIHSDYHYLTSIIKKRLYSKNTSKNKRPIDQQQFINFIITNS